VKRTEWIVAPAGNFSLMCLAARTFDIDLDKCVENRVEPCDPRKMGFDQFHRRNLLMANLVGQGGSGKIVEVGHLSVDDESSSLTLV
jgi:hypothetical protein